MNASAAVRAVMSTDDTLADPRGVARSEQLTDDDDDDVLVDTRGRQVKPLPTKMTAAEALEDSLGPRR